MHNWTSAGFNEPVIGALVSLPDSGEPQLNRLVLRTGFYPQGGDELLLNEPFAEAHGLRVGDQIGAIMNGRKRTLRITGTALSPEFVYAMGPGALMPDAQRYGVAWMRYGALAAAYDLDTAFNDVVITTWPGTRISEVLLLVDDVLARYGGVGAYEREDQVSHWFVSNEIAQLESIASIMPPIFLAVAAFLTNMVMARLVYMERGEIGLLKAFGYSNLTMAWHYAKMVLVIGSIGVLIGWVGGFWLGHWMTELYARLFRFPLIVFTPDYDIYVASALISLGTAMIGVVAAARRAASLPPAEAMREPSPPMFRQRFAGVKAMFARLDQPTRIIFRQVFRRPVRALLTSLGVAASAAVFIASLQWLDALDYMIDDFFREQQRQDVVIAMTEPVHQDIVRNLSRLPGVQMVEPHRAISARLRAGVNSRREGIAGLPVGGALEAVHDKRGRSVAVPAEGLLMSSVMADILDVDVGDQVTVEVLEGRRPIVSVPVAAVFETVIGTPVYMNIDALNRVLKEPQRVNLAFALLDENQRDALFAALKATPVVAGVTLKYAAVDLFKQTIAESMYIMVAFYGLFAAVLAFGVVYNNMRIALSERGRELATLRVLGFSTNEIAYMLFGEAVVLILMGLPVGCLAGWALAEFMAQGLATELYRIPVVIQPSTYGAGLVVVLAAAVASALLMIKRLRSLSMIAVLKTRE